MSIITGNPVGRYEQETSENFDNYLKAAGTQNVYFYTNIPQFHHLWYRYTGVNIVKRAAAAAAKATLEISVTDDGVYTIKTFSVFKNTTINFKLGQQFDEQTADGRDSKV